jgi:hypothetical protein
MFIGGQVIDNKLQLNHSQGQICSIDLPNSVASITLVDNNITVIYANGKTLKTSIMAFNDITYKDGEFVITINNKERSCYISIPNKFVITNNKIVLHDYTNLPITELTLNMELNLDEQTLKLIGHTDTDEKQKVITSIKLNDIFDVSTTKKEYELDIKCCNEHKKINIFNNYYDVVKQYDSMDDTKYKSIIYDNYYTLNNDKLVFDVDKTLKSMKYSLLILDDTQYMYATVAESVTNQHYELDFSNLTYYTSIKKHMNYKRIQKIYIPESLEDVFNDKHTIKLN